MCLEARAGRGDEQEAGEVLEACRNGRRQTGAMRHRGEAPQY
jgi:hypothetical protein